MKHSIALIVGMVLIALGGQGGIRLLVDHDNAGLLRWMPGGFGVWLSCYAVATAVGIGLAAWAGPKARQAGNG